MFRLFPTARAQCRAAVLGGLLVLPQVGLTDALSGRFSCEMRTISGPGWIPPKLTMRFGEGEDRGQSGAQDSDQSGEQASKQNAKNFGEVIHNSTGGLIAGHPLKATFFAMGPMSYRISWSVMGAGLANAGDTGEVHYRATMNLRNMKLSLQVISGMIEGDQPRAVGQCQRLPDNSPDGSPDTVQIGEIITEQG